MRNYESPGLDKAAFNCPYCEAYAHQKWHNLSFAHYGYFPLKQWKMAFCSCCGELSLWNGVNIVFPNNSIAPFPHEDLPEDLKADFNEAREILLKSPRGAGALLRLVLQKLCKSLGEKGKDINEDIASLVKKGLPVKLQQALDSIRVIGNEAVHPGELDLRDDLETVSSLFELLNMIVEVMISQDKKVEAVYLKIPPNKLEGIQKRDSQ